MRSLNYVLSERIPAGADVVLVDGPDLPPRVAVAIGKARITLALDYVGGSAAQRLLDSIVLYGMVVVYSSMSGQPPGVAAVIRRGQLAITRRSTGEGSRVCRGAHADETVAMLGRLVRCCCPITHDYPLTTDDSAMP
jgi:NADPH:quinone reductase-like Zn-dependent oxidoreductase